MVEENKPKRKPRGFKIKPREKPKKDNIKPIREPRKIGYMRVSTEKQDHTLQYNALVAAGVNPEDIFRDTISGSKVSREGRDACMKFLISGDTLMVWKLDRFSRSLKDILTQLDDFYKRGIGFISVTQSLDTTTPAGRAMIQMIGIFAEFERETIRERVKAGIQAVRAADPTRKWGRKPSVEYDEAEVLGLLKKNSVRAVAKMTGVPKSTVQLISTRAKNEKAPEKTA